MQSLLCFQWHAAFNNELIMQSLLLFSLFRLGLCGLIPCFCTMGADQSAQHPPAGAPGSTLKSQRDEDIPYTSYAISKPIDSSKYNPDEI